MSNGETEDLREYTIDELALAAGLPSRTVRHYQSQGTLPPPRRAGRLAFYGEVHLERLRLIGRLQDRGLRLDAIRDALREVEKGHLSLEAWLGLGEQVRAPWSADAPQMVTDAEFREQFGDLPPGLLAALGKTDLVRLQAGGPPATYLIPSPGLLHIVLALRESGIDLEVAGAAIELLRKHTRRTADDLARFLLDRTGKGFASAGTPEDVTQALAALRTRAMEVVDLLFAQEMERAVRAAFEQGRPRLARTS